MMTEFSEMNTEVLMGTNNEGNHSLHASVKDGVSYTIFCGQNDCLTRARIDDFHSKIVIPHVWRIRTAPN
jgi:hypothetical protein